MTELHLRTMKISSLFLSPNCVGERGSPAPLCINQRIRDDARRQVRGHLPIFYYITPHLYPLPSPRKESGIFDKGRGT